MKEFLKSLFSWKVTLNIWVMILLFCGIVVGSYFSLGAYTHHGEKVVVPNVCKKIFKNAKNELHKLGLEIQVSDTVYLKHLPADLIMEQTPVGGKKVKPGRIIYVVINAGHSPRRIVPDIVDNSSAREAKAMLEALGFHSVEIQYGPGEKDWVVDMISNGKHVLAGDELAVDAHLVLIVGDGTRDLGDSVTYTEPLYYYEEDDDASVYRKNESHADDADYPAYTQEEVEEEIERNVDDELEQLMKEKHQKNQSTEGGAIPEPVL